MNAFNFEQLTLFVPELWDKPWDEHIAEAEGLEREFLFTLSRYARALKQIAPAPATPAKVTWLAIWSRFYGCLMGVRGAAGWEARLPVTVLARVNYEAALHLQAIMLPVLEAADNPTDALTEKHWQAVRDRMCGYVAWCLRGDEDLISYVARQEHLDAAFDPKPERELISSLGNFRDTWERLLGRELELISDQEAFQDRARAADFARAERNRITLWLSDARVQPWYRKLRRLEGATKGFVTLFELLDVGKSVPTFLRRRETSVGYFGYLQGSTAIHGNSLGSAMWVTKGVLTPEFASLGGNHEQLAQAILSECRLHVLLLELLAKHLDT